MIRVYIITGNCCLNGARKWLKTQYDLGHRAVVWDENMESKIYPLTADPQVHSLVNHYTAGRIGLHKCMMAMFGD